MNKAIIERLRVLAIQISQHRKKASEAETSEEKAKHLQQAALIEALAAGVEEGYQLREQ